MKYPIDVGKVKGMHKKIWDRIRGTFGLPRGTKALPIFGHYGGVFQVGKELLVIHCDGVGTKVLVARKLGKYDTIGIDAVAMSVNDILCLGAEPLVGVDYIALSNEDEILVDELMKGLVSGAQDSNCAILGGETAVVPELLHDEKTFDLTFTVVGKVYGKLITGQACQPGDILIGLESSGLHSNGYSLARKILDIEKWGKEMLEPTRIYVKRVLAILAEEELHGIAHITGGAFSKLTRINNDVGFLLNNMPKMPRIFDELHKSVGDIGDMYKTFNCGVGMVLVAKKESESDIHKILKRWKLKSYVIGEIINKPGVWLEYGNKSVDLNVRMNSE